jgi:hypothetical protein
MPKQKKPSSLDNIRIRSRAEREAEKAAKSNFKVPIRVEEHVHSEGDFFMDLLLFFSFWYRYPDEHFFKPIFSPSTVQLTWYILVLWIRNVFCWNPYPDRAKSLGSFRIRIQNSVFFPAAVERTWSYYFKLLAMHGFFMHFTCRTIL